MSERITLVNPYVIYECPDCGVKVATDSPDSVPDCPDCGLLGVALEFVGLGEFISAESKAEIERLRRERENVIEGLADELRHAVARQVRDGRCVECGRTDGHAFGCWVGEAEKTLRASGGGES